MCRLLDLSGLMPKGVESVRALPNLCPGVANASLREGITFDLDGELEGLLNEVGSALVGVFDGFEVLIPFEHVRAAVMEDGDAGRWVGLRDSPVLAGEEFETPACGRSLAYFAGFADQNPCSNQVFGELRRRSGGGRFIVRMQNDDCRCEGECEQTEGGSSDDVSIDGNSFHIVPVNSCWTGVADNRHAALTNNMAHDGRVARRLVGQQFA